MLNLTLIDPQDTFEKICDWLGFEPGKLEQQPNTLTMGVLRRCKARSLSNFGSRLNDATLNL